MPTASRTFDSKHLTRNILEKNRQLSVVNCQLCPKRGFTLIEIVLSLFLILAIVSILFSASGTYIHSRRSNLRAIATKIASKQIETLRNTNFASLPPSGSFFDPDLNQLPSGSAIRTVADYQSSTKIKQVTTQVSWIESNVSEQIVLETLISEHGL